MFAYGPTPAQGTGTLAISGTGDALTAAPTWAAASILEASPAGNITIDVAGCPDGGSRWLWLTPANTKTVTISATGGTIGRLEGADTNPFTGDGTATTVVAIARKGTEYGVTIIAKTTFS